MLIAKIKNYNENLINRDRMTIDLIYDEDIIIEPKQVKFITWSDAEYNLSDEVIGFAYSKEYQLYAPYKFIWKNNDKFHLAIYNKSNKQLIINKNTYIATIRLMSIQFYNLMRKHDNSDRNLASAKIDIIWQH